MDEKELYKQLEIAKSKLNDRQIAFCENYLNLHNASEAYRNAGYSTNSEKGVRASASKLLSKPNISEYISISKQINEKFSRITREDLIRTLESMIKSTSTPKSEVRECMKLLMQMNGWNAPTVTKTEITYNDESIKRMNEISGMSYEEKVEKLKQLKEHVQFNN